MSLWTPGGEHEVPKDDDGVSSTPTGAPGAAGAPGQPPLSPDQEAEAAQIAAEMAETVAGGHHYRMLFMLGAVLFAVTFVLNMIGDLVIHRFKQRLEGKK